MGLGTTIMEGGRVLGKHRGGKKKHGRKTHWKKRKESS